MYKFKIFVLVIVGFVLLSSMAWVKLTLVRPALIALPEYIKSIAVIDRTLQDESAENKFEQTITGEFFKQDEQAVRQTIEGIIDVCSEYNLYTVARTSERYIGDGTKTTFPSALNWQKVSELCDKHQVDAILAIEIFDSDFLVTNPVNVVRQITEGKVIPGHGYHINGIAVINFGVRLYDPASKKILDEYQVSHRINFGGSGSTALDVANQVLDKTEAINRTSYQSGRIYGERITPSYYTVTREFYNKPKRNNDLSSGVRNSEVADWNGAIESWTKALNSKRKIAGRAAFNIAVAYEVLGELEKAKEWASKSYTEYREKRGNDYYRMLVNRIKEESITKNQVSDK